MNTIKITPMQLSLFGEQEGASGLSGEIQAGPVSTRRDSSGEIQQEVSSAPGETTEAPAASDTMAQRRKAFLELVNGEYKDIYTGETQRIISQRFKHQKAMEQQLEQQTPIMELLEKKYGQSEPSALLTALNQEPDEETMTLLREDNARLAREVSQLSVLRTMEDWIRQGEQIGQMYPEFSLEEAAEDPELLRLLGAGVPLRQAYEVLHLEQLRQKMEQESISRVEARNRRPAENGTASQNAFSVKEDVSRLNRHQRAALARRAANGETIRF